MTVIAYRTDAPERIARLFPEYVTLVAKRGLGSIVAISGTSRPDGRFETEAVCLMPDKADECATLRIVHE